MNPINDLSFWEELKLNQAEDRHLTYLCHTSSAFAKAWDEPTTREQLKQLAKKFYQLEGDKYSAELPPERIASVIFCAGARKDDQLIRQAFIQWNINRLTP